MAKSKGRRATVRRARFNVSEWESAGWGFWLISFFATLPLCVWGMSQILYEGVTFWAAAVFGFVGAAAIAGFLSWLVNSLLQARVARREKAGDNKKQKARQ